MNTSSDDIEVMLHFYCSAEPHPRAHAPAVSEAIVRLVNEGLLERSSMESGSLRLRATKRGSAWVKMICRTPMPVHAWKNPLTGEVVA